MPPMDMIRLMAGCALSADETGAIADLIRLKKQVTERGEAGRSDPLLDALMEREIEATEAWLQSSDRPAQQAELRMEGDRLFRDFVLRSAGA